MFNEKYNGKLIMFNLEHIITLLVLCVLLALLVLFRKKFLNEKNDKIFRYTLASGLLIFEVAFHIWVAVRGQYTYDMLPFTGLCAMTNLLTIIALFTNNKKIIALTIYWAMAGAMFSLIFIDIEYGIPHFRYFHYFLVHFGFLVGNLYYYLTDRVQIDRKHINLSCIILFTYSMIMLGFDLLLDKNWFYMLISPVEEISDFFKAPWYTILWVLAISILLNGFYFLLKLLKREEKLSINN